MPNETKRRETVFGMAARMAARTDKLFAGIVGDTEKYRTRREPGPVDARPLQLPPTDVAVLHRLVECDTTRTRNQLLDDLLRFDDLRLDIKTIRRAVDRLIAGGQVEEPDGGGVRATTVGREYVRHWPTNRRH